LTTNFHTLLYTNEISHTNHEGKGLLSKDSHVGLYSARDVLTKAMNNTDINILGKCLSVQQSVVCNPLSTQDK